MYPNRQRLGAFLLICFIHSLAASAVNASDDARQTPLVKAVQKCQESVVNIHTEKNSKEDTESRFFTPKPRRVTGMGTGIVVDERGYIVTNYHVIHDVDQITVTLRNGDLLDASPVSFDRKQDLAIIRVKSPKPLPVMDMGVSSEVMLAEQVFAIGNAFGYEHTVTDGIVSAIGRDVEVDETQSYENLLQTSAAINPGNSGGPLLNLNGEVIGINVAIRAGAQRIGFAIPIDDARRTVARLLSTERLNGLSHGVFATDVQVNKEKRLVIDTVTPGSAAAICGLKKGDTVTTVRGINIADNADWERSLLDIPVGRKLDVELLRDGQPVSLTFTVGSGANSRNVASKSKSSTAVKTVSTARPANSSTTRVTPARQKTRQLLGLQLALLTPDETASLVSTYIGGVKYSGGMKIVGVDRGSKAERHGIRKGDLLLGLDRFETLNDRNLTYILQDSRLAKMKKLEFQIFRDGKALEGQIDL